MRWLEWALIWVGSLGFLANVMVHVALVGARISLGRWPHRMGMDDPWGVAWIQPLLWITSLLMLLWFVASVPAVLLVVALACHRAWVRLVRGALLGLLLWKGAEVFWQWDPAEAWTWFFD